MKRIVIVAVALLAAGAVAQGQVRDRRGKLDIQCSRSASVSSTGRLWLSTRCGAVYTADSVGATWRTVWPRQEHTGELIIPFGDRVALKAGFIPISHYENDRYMPHYDCLFRTVTVGQQWDTVQFGTGTHWICGRHYTADGHLWMGSAQSGNPGHLFYSADSGRTFTTLRTGFDAEVKIEDIHMVSLTTGVLGTYNNQIYLTTDNWRTFRRLPTPLDQGLRQGRGEYVTLLRLWHGMLLVRQADGSYVTPVDSIRWQPTPLPLVDFEVDTVGGALWAVTDSGQLLLMHDMEHHRVMADGIGAPLEGICGTLGGGVYLLTAKGVVRMAPDGRADTSAFYTDERTIEQEFDEQAAKWGSYFDVHPTISHGGRLWCTDHSCIYLQDALGWYRVADLGSVAQLRPDPDRDDRIVVLAGDRHNYTVDTAGRVAPYTYRQPLARFLASGLQGVGICTYNSGCYHYDEHTIVYTRQGELLRESANNVDSMRHVVRYIPADTVERTLLRLGERYSLFPEAADFGLREGDVDLHERFSRFGGCTSSSGYKLTFVNGEGDTLRAYGASNADCGGYFPWMLPMHFEGSDVAFVTYQPSLWQVLRTMMPKGMKHRDKLNNNALVDLRPGDLLFYSDEGGMNDAVRESTGQYTHVALVESVGDTVWIIDATQTYGVSRRPLLRKRGGPRPYPDVYRLEAASCTDIDSVIARARSFVGQPYDNAFLPDNGALYCSELIYEVFLDDCHQGRHLFEAKPMNWRNAKGRLPKYWKRHFKRLRMAVPEGVPGTNPTDLSRSPLLRRL